MEHLYAPWRDEYIGKKVNSCVFCDISQTPKDDSKNHVLYRDEICYVVMNKYPYTVGHFLVIPHAHTDKLEDLQEKQWLHISLLVQRGVKMLKEGFGAKGVNIGMNLGAEAGAGIAPHIHYHLLPRYAGDTNFISTIGQTRVYSTDFEAVYQKLLKLSKEYLL